MGGRPCRPFRRRFSHRLELRLLELDPALEHVPADAGDHRYANDDDEE
jgi:hypothetical protein